MTNRRRAPNAIFLPNFPKGHELETELVPANGVVVCLFKFGLLSHFKGSEYHFFYEKLSLGIEYKYLCTQRSLCWGTFIFQEQP